jgi:hypothetical protein
MLEIEIPHNNVEERLYSISVLLGEILGIQFKVTLTNRRDYLIKLPNHSELAFSDGFFNNFISDLSYLNQKNIPNSILWVNSEFLVQPHLPVLFGVDLLEISDKKITVGYDIFASSFFMLSRWEEYVITDRDRHGRVASSHCIAGKFNFLDRPIVNEYAEFIWNLLLRLDGRVKRISRESRNFVSCDVDLPYDLSRRNFYQTIKRSIARSLRSDLGKPHFPLMNYFANSLDTRYDLYWLSLKWIMDVNESAGNIVDFNFIPYVTADNYDPKFSFDDNTIRNTLRNILERGHRVGFHPGYSTYNDAFLFNHSLDIFKNVLCLDKRGLSTLGGRQHFLRWSFPASLHMWADSGLKYDSTLGFADRAGFRCGVCTEFSLFDVMNRCSLNLKERPLIVMECSVISSNYMGYGRTDKAANFMLGLKNICQKYKGDFSVLWHNTALETAFDRETYEMLIS